MAPAEMIAAAREAAGLTQAELARRAGTSQATVSAYEAGRKDPAAGTLVRLLAAAGQRLTTEPTGSVVMHPGRAERERRGRELVEVLRLAAALPARPAQTIGFPPLRTLTPTSTS